MSSENIKLTELATPYLLIKLEDDGKYPRFKRELKKQLHEVISEKNVYLDYIDNQSKRLEIRLKCNRFIPENKNEVEQCYSLNEEGLKTFSSKLIPKLSRICKQPKTWKYKSLKKH